MGPVVFIICFNGNVEFVLCCAASRYHDGVMGLWFMTGERCTTPGCANEPDMPASIEDIPAERRVFTKLG